MRDLKNPMTRPPDLADLHDIHPSHLNLLRLLVSLPFGGVLTLSFSEILGSQEDVDAPTHWMMAAQMSSAAYANSAARLPLLPTP
jgi:hypothetical protein